MCQPCSPQDFAEFSCAKAADLKLSRLAQYISINMLDQHHHCKKQLYWLHSEHSLLADMILCIGLVSLQQSTSCVNAAKPG